VHMRRDRARGRRDLGVDGELQVVCCTAWRKNRRSMVRAEVWRQVHCIGGASSTLTTVVHGFVYCSQTFREEREKGRGVVAAQREEARVCLGSIWGRRNRWRGG
jgi:hypothetical protein